MFKYIFNTWLLSNLFHPLFFIVFGIIKVGFSGTIGTAIFTLTGYIFLISLLISLPCLFLGWLCVKTVVNSIAIYDEWKFMLWLLLALLLVFVEFLIFLMVIDLLENEMLLYSMPAVFSTAFSVGVRSMQFYKISSISKIEKSEQTTVV